jgi:two-component system sensor histidine kinase KdpD
MRLGYINYDLIKIMRFLFYQNSIIIFTNMRLPTLISRPFQYLLAIGSIALITAIFLTLRDVLDTTLIGLLYLIPLGLITAFLGLGPGITCAVITFLTLNYFFIPPFYTLAVHRPTDVVILVVFLVVAVVISQLVGRLQSSLGAANTREREATQLYELSIALTGLHNDHAIAQILARQVHAVSQGEYVELNITDGKPFSFHLPEITPPTRRPEFTVPIQTARGVFGRFCFGRPQVPALWEKCGYWKLSLARAD